MSEDPIEDFLKVSGRYVTVCLSYSFLVFAKIKDRLGRSTKMLLLHAICLANIVALSLTLMFIFKLIPKQAWHRL